METKVGENQLYFFYVIRVFSKNSLMKYYMLFKIFQHETTFVKFHIYCLNSLTASLTTLFLIWYFSNGSFHTSMLAVCRLVALLEILNTTGLLVKMNSSSAVAYSLGDFGNYKMFNISSYNSNRENVHVKYATLGLVMRSIFVSFFQTPHEMNSAHLVNGKSHILAVHSHQIIYSSIEFEQETGSGKEEYAINEACGMIGQFKEFNRCIRNYTDVFQQIFIKPDKLEIKKHRCFDVSIYEESMESEESSSEYRSWFFLKPLVPLKPPVKSVKEYITNFESKSPTVSLNSSILVKSLMYARKFLLKFNRAFNNQNFNEDSLHSLTVAFTKGLILQNLSYVDRKIELNESNNAKVLAFPFETDKPIVKLFAVAFLMNSLEVVSISKMNQYEIVMRLFSDTKFVKTVHFITYSRDPTTGKARTVDETFKINQGIVALLWSLVISTEINRTSWTLTDPQLTSKLEGEIDRFLKQFENGEIHTLLFHLVAQFSALGSPEMFIDKTFTGDQNKVVLVASDPSKALIILFEHVQNVESGYWLANLPQSKGLYLHIRLSKKELSNQKPHWAMVSGATIQTFFDIDIFESPSKVFDEIQLKGSIYVCLLDFISPHTQLTINDFKTSIQGLLETQYINVAEQVALIDNNSALIFTDEKWSKLIIIDFVFKPDSDNKKENCDEQKNSEIMHSYR